MTELDQPDKSHHAEDIPGQDVPKTNEQKLEEEVGRIHDLVDRYHYDLDDRGDAILKAIDGANDIKLDIVHKPGFSVSHHATRAGRSFRIKSERFKRVIRGQ